MHLLTHSFVRLSINSFTHSLIHLFRYKEDFGYGVGTSQLFVLNFVRRHLSPSDQAAMDGLLDGIGFGARKIRCKYADYSGACHMLELLPIPIPKTQTAVTTTTTTMQRRRD